MRNFQDTFETCKQSRNNVLSICMTVPLKRSAATISPVPFRWELQGDII